MINFSVGPVQSSETVLKIGAESCPYFRTPEFSEIMLGANGRVEGQYLWPALARTMIRGYEQILVASA